MYFILKVSEFEGVQNCFLMFFYQISFVHFPEEEERRRRRQAKGQENYLAGDTLKLSEYGHKWKRPPLPSYASYDTGAFEAVPRLLRGTLSLLCIHLRAPRYHYIQMS
jgi:hypothetical protein